MQTKATLRSWKIRFRLLELVIHLVLLVLLLSATVRPVGAQTEYKPSLSVHETTASSQAESASESAKKPEYELPYAGVLPGNPFYFFKTIRDRIVDFLITDTDKKAEFTLLQSEKRASAVIVLAKDGKMDLAESTASKGAAYAKRAVEQYMQAKGEGKDVNPFLTKLIASLDKQIKVYEKVQEDASGDTKDRFLIVIEEIKKVRGDL